MIDQGFPVRKVLSYVDINASYYYYIPRQGKRGKRPSQFTYKVNGQRFTNEKVVKQIQDLLSEEFVDYGYVKVTYYLTDELGYLINKKKVYRLMKENKLLYSNRKAKRMSRQWVTELVPKPEAIFENLELDIKYFYIHGQRKNAQQATLLDVKSRYVLNYVNGWGITKDHIKKMFEIVFETYNRPKSVYVRTDNGSQFISQEVQAYIATLDGVYQEYTRPATPQQNAHIEALHSIMERSICRAYFFETMEEFQCTMKRFIAFYNEKRIHSGIDYMSPLKYIKIKHPEFKLTKKKQIEELTSSLMQTQLEGLKMSQSVSKIE